MIRLYCYIFYKLKKHYGKKGDAFAVFGGIFLMHFITLLNLLAPFSFPNHAQLFVQQDIAVRRFVIIPSVYIPILILIFIYYKVNKKKIEFYWQEFEQLENQERKAMNRSFKAYILLMAIAMILSFFYLGWMT